MVGWHFRIMVAQVPKERTVDLCAIKEHCGVSQNTFIDVGEQTKPHPFYRDLRAKEVRLGHAIEKTIPAQSLKVYHQTLIVQRHL